MSAPETCEWKIRELRGQEYHANREGQVAFLINGSFVPSTDVTATSVFVML